MGKLHRSASGHSGKKIFLWQVFYEWILEGSSSTYLWERDVGQTSRNSLARFNLPAGYHQKYRIFLCGCEDSLFKQVVTGPKPDHVLSLNARYEVILVSRSGSPDGRLWPDVSVIKCVPFLAHLLPQHSEGKRDPPDASAITDQAP